MDGGGYARPGFEAVHELFRERTAVQPGVNAAVAAYLDGEPVVDLWAGPGYRENSIQSVYSSTKGAAGIVLAMLVQQGAVDPDEPVARYWPEFAAGDKERIPVRVLASHQAGLISVDGGYRLADLLAHDPLAERLAAQRPMWEPGTGHGYHALTIGPLVDELVRRVTGARLGEFFRKEIAEPYGVDFFIGLPEDQEHRIVPTKPLGGPPPGIKMPRFFEVAMRPDPEAATAGPPVNLPDMREFRAAGLASIGGLGSARGLAALYSAAVRGGLLTRETIRRVTAVQSSGPDLVLMMPTSYGHLFETPSPGGVTTLGPGTFGHSGASGALGYADPDLGLAFGYITDTPSAQGTAAPLAVELSAALARCAAA